MKYKLLVLIICLHLLLIIVRSFSNIIPQKPLIKSTSINLLLDTYTQYTAMQADYAFFSPDVGYSPFVKIKINIPADSFYVPFYKPQNEVALRLFTSLNAFNNTPEARELMARSWAAYALKNNPKAGMVTVSYFIKIPPAITQFAQGKRVNDSLLFEVKYKVNAQ